MDASQGRLFPPMHNRVARPLCRTLISDASRYAVGSFCLETGQYWLHELFEEGLARRCGSSKHLHLQESTHKCPQAARHGAVRIYVGCGMW